MLAVFASGWCVSVVLLFCAAHTSRVTGLKYVKETEWLLSVSRDKSMQWHCTKTGRKLGVFEAHAWCLAVEYPLFVSCVMFMPHLYFCRHSVVDLIIYTVPWTATYFTLWKCCCYPRMCI